MSQPDYRLWFNWCLCEFQTYIYIYIFIYEDWQHKDPITIIIIIIVKTSWSSIPQRCEEKMWKIISPKVKK